MNERKEKKGSIVLLTALLFFSFSKPLDSPSRL